MYKMLMIPWDVEARCQYTRSMRPQKEKTQTSHPKNSRTHVSHTLPQNKTSHNNQKQ